MIFARRVGVWIRLCEFGMAAAARLCLVAARVSLALAFFAERVVEAFRLRVAPVAAFFVRSDRPAAAEPGEIVAIVIGVVVHLGRAVGGHERDREEAAPAAHQDGGELRHGAI